MKQNLPFLRHILDEIDFILNVTNGFTFEEFFSNEILKRACTRSFEIIGEAVKNLSNELREEYEDVEWKKFSGMRDKIIHFYFGVDYNILWQAITEKLPDLKEKVIAIINEIDKNEN